MPCLQAVWGKIENLICFFRMISAIVFFSLFPFNMITILCIFILLWFDFLVLFLLPILILICPESICLPELLAVWRQYVITFIYVGLISPLKSICEKPGIVPMNNVAFSNVGKFSIQALGYSGRLISSQNKLGGLTVSCQKTSEATVAANSNGKFLWPIGGFYFYRWCSSQHPILWNGFCLLA